MLKGPLMPMMEDSEPRQLWWLTRMFLLISRPLGETEINEHCTSGDYINENTAS